MSSLLEKIRSWSHKQQCLGKKGSNPMDVLKQVIAVYSAHPSGPLSLHARLSDFSASDFVQLDQQKQAVRIPAMRLSVHLVPVQNTSSIISATVPSATDPVWAKRYGQKGREIPAANYEEWKKDVLKHTQQPKTAKKLKTVLSIPPEKQKMVLNRMAFERYLLRVGAPNTRSNTIQYVATNSWTKPLVQQDQQQALQWLAKAYLKAFGPATIKDFKWWAGISVSQAKQAFKTLHTEMLDNGLILLSEDHSSFEAFNPQLEDTLDLLPQWDCYTMGYAPEGRQRFVEENQQKHIYGKIGATGGNGIGTILLNGLAIGAWKGRFKGTKYEVDIQLFEKPTQQIKERLSDKFDDTANFLGAKKLQLSYRIEP